MTEQEYRSHPAVSRSELWRLSESPEKFRYSKEHPEEPTPALLFGQVFHKLALEPDTYGETFVVAPVADRRTKAGKAEWEQFLETSQGKAVIPAEMHDLAAAMCQSLYSVPFVVKLLSGTRELPIFWTDELTGEECKCRLDCLNESMGRPIVVDLKSTNDAGTEAFVRDAVKYGYDLQAAMYSVGAERHTMQKPLFVFIVVEKKPPYAVNILQADEPFLARGNRLFRSFLDIYHDCKCSGNWYGYLGKDNQINTLSLPAWVGRNEE